MAATLLLLLLAQGSPLADLAHDSRAVREAAIRSLAAGGPSSLEIAALLKGPDERVALGAAEVLRLRRDPSVLTELALAADSQDAARGAAAAAALVATAGEALVDLDVIAPPERTVLAARLDEAYRGLARQALIALDVPASTDRPQVYRGFFGGGAHAARALHELAADASIPENARAHAIHALARLTGEAPVEALDDAEPAVRGAAAVLVLRYGDARALARLAARLDETSALQTIELHCAAIAARRTGGLGPEGARRLAQAVRDREPRLAADAAAALLASDPEAGMRALRGRVSPYLQLAEREAGTGTEAVVFELRAGPLPDDLRARMAAVPDPLLAACVSADPVATFRPMLSRAAGGREGFRIDVASRVLRQPGAETSDRVAFAGSVLTTDFSSARRAGLEALRGAEPEAWSALLPLVTASLSDREESVRVAAAALLLPDPAALEVCARALYDGDPWTAKSVASMLSGGGGGSGAGTGAGGGAGGGDGGGGAAPGKVDPRAPVAERRRAALEILGRTLRGKE